MGIASNKRSRAVRAMAAALLLAGGALAACSSDEPDSQDEMMEQFQGIPEETGMPEAEPTRGGQLLYGIEAESDSYCLTDSQLAIAGMQVMRSIYDSITMPNADGGYSPYLAKSVEHNADYTQWTIILRDGITFHDGSVLDAQVIKNNIDAFRGEYENRSSLLFSFAMQDIESVQVINELEVRVNTAVPWVAFPAHLYSSGRFGIMAQAQLDASEEECRTNPIGTGPFMIQSWEENVRMRLVRNPNYWQTAPDGEPYPYVDAIEYIPNPNSDSRLADLLRGDLNIMHTNSEHDIFGNMPDLVDDGAINLLSTQYKTETSYTMFNASEEPFSDRRARLAAVQAINREELNEKANGGHATLADGPFAPGVPGYVEDPGFPPFDLEAAKATVAELKEEGIDTTVTFVATTDPTVVRQAQVIKEMVEAAGFEVTMEVEQQEDLISRAIRGEYQMTVFRNQPGEDPDMNYVWWFGEGNPVNFGKFDDAEINRLLKAARGETDPATRTEYYQEVTRRLVTEAYNGYGWYVPWAVAEAPNVHGILGPALPDGSQPRPTLVEGHAVHGLWIEREAGA